jgi:VWFA-related protein
VLLRVRAGFVLLPCLLVAQSGDELTSHEEAVTFRSRTNLVMVPVVVRDAEGRAVANLLQDQFHLFDNGKPQVISRFSLETSGTERRPAERQDAAPNEPAAEAVLPDRFLLYLFDDVHIEFGDLAQVQAAASRHLAGLKPTDRAAIFTISGRTSLDFTDDRDKLRNTLMGIKPSPLARGGGLDCPAITYYMADEVRNKNDGTLREALIQWTMQCQQLKHDPAASVTDGLVSQVLNEGRHEAQVAVTNIRDAVRRISAMPGRRSLVLVSPGFLMSDQEPQISELLDRAVHTNVVVNALDVRGVYTPDLMGDISHYSPPGAVAGVISHYFLSGQRENGAVLATLASGTGGRLYSGNDFDRGLNQLAGPAEAVYYLGFTPQNLRFDGKFHNLKVSIDGGRGLIVQARHGYYAPSGAVEAAETARREIEEALFSRDEIREIPAGLHTQFFKRDDANARLSVVAKLDLKTMRFRQDEGRSCDVLTVVAGLFDRNGNLVSATRNTVDMRLHPQTLAKALNTGLTVRTSFDVHPGTYVVRLVVRDAEGQMMTAQNGAVEIP